MRRREFIAFIGAVSMLPRAARSQQSTKVYRIAILHPSNPVTELTEASHLPHWRAWFHELRRLGYIEGQNLVIDRYSGEGRVETYPRLANDAATRHPNLIFAVSNFMAIPLKEATSAIPVVAMTSDPVDLGLVTSIARPGGNITGVSVDAGLEIWDKRLQLLREIAPTISKVGILALQKNREAGSMQETAQRAGIAVVGPFADNGSEEEYRRVLAIMSQDAADALFVGESPEHIAKRKLIGELAEKYRLPAIYPFRSFAEAGGLMSYGINFVEIFRQVARQIDQVLKGAKPGDIPFYQPTKFELVINRKAAKDIGLVISEPVLARADEVIE
jgi:putative ABC transport system substrate-binding protein